MDFNKISRFFKIFQIENLIVIHTMRTTVKPYLFNGYTNNHNSFNINPISILEELHELLHLLKLRKKEKFFNFLDFLFKVLYYKITNGSLTSIINLKFNFSANTSVRATP